MKIHEYNIFWNGMDKQYKPNARFNYCNIMNVYKYEKKNTSHLWLLIERHGFLRDKKNRIEQTKDRCLAILP